MNENIAVMKFGGTSLKTFEQRHAAALRVIEMKHSGKSPVVVVSAMGRLSDSYATDTLINMLIDENPDASRCNMDMIASCGEIISAAILSETIRKMGYESIALNGSQAGIHTDSRFREANVESMDPENILKWIDKDYIVIVTGFQGIDPNGFFTTLGRGGSDYSAVVLAKSLNMKKVYILKDVSGVLTADPKITNKAHLIETLSYDELCEMSKSGAKVVNFKAVSYAKENGIALFVKSLFSPIGIHGTVITESKEIDSPYSKEKLLTAIVSKDGLIQYNLSVKSSSTILDLLKRLSENEISIDMINLCKNSQYFAIDEEKQKLADSILANLKIKYDLRRECSKLTIVGQAIHGVPGIMSSLLYSLDNIGIDVFQTSDSNTTISLIIDSCDVKAATEKIHDVFKL
ncbi:MAG: aspartate kinase [Peptostreptococcaceae bacterium]|nr:aspartate kinase [Peptostreptococcaceae bacterium]